MSPAYTPRSIAGAGLRSCPSQAPNVSLAIAGCGLAGTTRETPERAARKDPLLGAVITVVAVQAAQR